MRSFGLHPLYQPRIFAGPMLWPRADLRRCDLLRRGALVVDHRGREVARGEYDEVRACYPDLEVEQVEGVLAPALADLHLHWVQYAARRAPKHQLLPWLEQVIYPAEAALAAVAPGDAPARALSADFWKAMTTNGILSSCIFATSSATSVDLCLERAVGLHVCGDAIMTMRCHAALRRDPEESLAEVKRLHQRWGAGYVVSPRFALSVGEELLALLGAYARDHGLMVQTHLSENRDEIAQTLEAFADARDYTDVYDRCGLLGPRTVVAHGIHLSERELDVLAQRRCVIAHCPSSNRALGSGRMSLDRITAAGVEWTLASDIGAGPDICPFDVMREFLELHAGHSLVSAQQAFARASQCAIPSRLLPQHPPARFVLLSDAGLPARRREATDAEVEAWLYALIGRYARTGKVADVLWKVNFGGRWL